MPLLCQASSVLALLALAFPASAWSNFLRQDIHSLDVAPEDHAVWNDIIPSEKLDFTPCYKNFSCARLTLPLDVLCKSATEEIALAIIRLPAVVPVDDPRYGGAIMTNPGGPANSGVLNVLDQGKIRQQIVDSPHWPSSLPDHRPDAKYYDILSFDPRGIGFSTPRLECVSGTWTGSVWDIESSAEGIFGSSPQAFDKMWARGQALSMACETSTMIASHMSTYAVVEDMVQLLDKLKVWRHSQQKPALTSRPQQLVTLDVGEEKLQYWGFSYGTVVGATFASMYPARVERMILDGVVDSDEWHKVGGLTAASIKDSDAVMDKFFQYCHNAGNQSCSFDDGSSPSDLAVRLEAILKDIRSDPIPVGPTATRGPEIVTYSDVINLISVALYSPLQYFEKLAPVFTDLSLRNGSRLADYKADNRKASPCDPRTNASCINIESWRPDARDAVACGDSVETRMSTKQQARQKSMAVAAASKWLGEEWAEAPIICSTWSVDPAAKFRGSIGGVPAHPLLLINNILDPVTPLTHAEKISRRFPGSVVLQQDAEGHCSYSAPSNCTHDVVRQYFQRGVLPERGMVCAPNRRPFQK